MKKKFWWNSRRVELRERSAYEDVATVRRTQEGPEGTPYLRMEAKNKIYKRSWRDHDGWMERKIGPTSRPLIEPTWNRSLGSGMNLGPLFAKLQLKDQRVRKLGIIYIMVVLVACSALPIEVMLGWIVLNIGILCFLLECFRVRSEHCEDLTNKTFYEGNWEKNSQANVKGEISKNESKKKIPQKESYDLSTEQVNQIKSQEKTYETFGMEVEP